MILVHILILLEILLKSVFTRLELLKAKETKIK